jgi:hypothetical protein
MTGDDEARGARAGAMTATALRRRRAAAQLLSGLREPPEAAKDLVGGTNPLEPPAAAQDLVGGTNRLEHAAAVSHLLAVQAQDLRAARLALRARGAAANAAEVDSALSEERSLVVGWLMRGTLHLVAREDYGWLHSLTAPLSAATSGRRLGQLGVRFEDAAPVMLRALTDEGPLSRAALGERVTVAGIRAEGQEMPHLLALAATPGQVVLGPVRDGVQCFALAHDWLGAPDAPAERDVALAELARRYLRGHGPATAADLAAWSGLSLRDARSGLVAIAGELEQRGELVDLAGRPEPPRRLPARLLPAFDPYLLGWRDRSFAVAAEHARRVHPGGGIVRATAVADGRVVGTWSRRRGAVVIEPFAPPPPRVAAALRREAAAIERFEGRTAH